VSVLDGCHVSLTDERHASELMGAKCLRHFGVRGGSAYRVVITHGVVRAQVTWRPEMNVEAWKRTMTIDLRRTCDRDL
jgi:hypothetical protein